MGEKDSTEVLKERYAKGKITRKQYLEMKAELGGEGNKPTGNNWTGKAGSSSSAPVGKTSMGSYVVRIAAVVIVIFFLLYLIGLANRNNPATTPSIKAYTIFNSSAAPVKFTAISPQCQPPQCGNLYYQEFTIPSNWTGASITGSYSAQSDLAMAILTPLQFATLNRLNNSASRKGCNILTKVASGKNDTCDQFVAVLTGLSAKSLPLSAVYSLYYNVTPIRGYSNLTIRPFNGVNVTYGNYMLSIYVNQTSSPSSSAWAQTKMNVSTIRPQPPPAITWLTGQGNVEYFTYIQSSTIDTQLAAGTYYMIFYYPGNSTDDLTITNPIVFSYDPGYEPNYQQPNNQTPTGQEPNGNGQQPNNTGETQTSDENLGGVNNSTWTGSTITSDIGAPGCVYESATTLTLTKSGTSLAGNYTLYNTKVITDPDPSNPCYLPTGSETIQVQGTISSSAISLSSSDGTTYTGGMTTDLMTLDSHPPPASAPSGASAGQCVEYCGTTMVMKLVRQS